jgi:hypothetical protein
MQKRFAPVCLLVHDIDNAIEDYRNILSVVDPQQVEKQIVCYDDLCGGDERLLAYPADEIWSEMAAAGLDEDVR